MARKTVKFNDRGVEKLPESKPVMYKIFTQGGKSNYVGVAKRGRVQDRIQEHLSAGKIPGAKVQVEQKGSVREAERAEERSLSRSKPKYNKQRR